MCKVQSLVAPRWAPVLVALPLLVGCASMRHRDGGATARDGAPGGAPSAAEEQGAPLPTASGPPATGGAGAQLEELRGLITGLATRLDALEGRLQTMNDRFESGAGRPKAVGVHGHPADGAGSDAPVSEIASDPDSGFSKDAAVTLYRDAMVLFQARKHAEAVLTFTGFLEKYPDHALAGSAQYYIGEAYFQQREMQMAEIELKKVLTSYDRSPHVADAIKRLAQVSESLKKPQEAARYRQLLTSLYPASPAAREDALVSATAAISQPVEAPPAMKAKASAAPVDESDVQVVGGEGGPLRREPGRPRFDEPPPPTAPLGATPPETPAGGSAAE